MRKVYVVGVGMTPFTKPKKDPKVQPQFPELGKKAVERALEDAGLKDKRGLIEQAFVGCLFNVGAGQRILYACDIHGIPISNLNNACATGSNALYLARQSVMSGLNECCLALGVEKMKPGSLGGGGDGGATALDEHYRVMYEARGIAKAPPMAQFFGGAGREHQALYGTTDDQFAMIGEKNHRHSANNPYSQFRDVYTLDQIKSAPKVFEMLTKTQCSPTSDGAAAAIVCSEDFVIKHGLQGQAIEIIAQSARTDSPSAFDQKNKKRTMIELIGSAMARNCANDVYQQSGLTPEDVDVVELHDCFSANELITYEALQLCGEGEGGKLIESGNATFGGKYVVNPSGGLISKGHPLGATGIAQCAELNWQLRGECGPRQVKDAKVGLQHNLGLGGLVVVTMYRKPEKWTGIAPKRAKSGAMGFPEDNAAASKL